MNSQNKLVFDAAEGISSVHDIVYSSSIASLCTSPQHQLKYLMQPQTNQTQQNTEQNYNANQIEENLSFRQLEQEQILKYQNERTQRGVLEYPQTHQKSVQLSQYQQSQYQQGQNQQQKHQKKANHQKDNGEAFFKDDKIELSSTPSPLCPSSTSVANSFLSTADLAVTSNLSHQQVFRSNALKEQSKKTLETPLIQGTNKDREIVSTNNNYEFYDPVYPIHRDFSTFSCESVNMILQKQRQKDEASPKSIDKIVEAVKTEKKEIPSLPPSISKHNSVESYQSKTIATLSSVLTSSNSSKNYGRQTRTNTFPVLLHQMLQFTDQSPNELYLISSKTGLNAMVCPKNILRWEYHGRSFLILDKHKLVDYLFPIFFPYQNEYPSFQRQLNLYGFTRLTNKKNVNFETTNTTEGQSRSTKSSTSNSRKRWQKRSHCSASSSMIGTPNPLQYYHEMFLRTRPDLCMSIFRTITKRVAGSSGRSSYDLDSEPNLESFPPLLAENLSLKPLVRQLPQSRIRASSAPQSPSIEMSQQHKTITEGVNERRGKEMTNPVNHSSQREIMDQFSAILESAISVETTLPLRKEALQEISDQSQLELTTFYKLLDSSCPISDEKVDNYAQINNRHCNLNEREKNISNSSPSVATSPITDNKAITKSSSSSSIASSTNWSLNRCRSPMNALGIQSDEYHNPFLLSPVNENVILDNLDINRFHSVVEGMSDVNSTITHDFCQQLEFHYHEQPKVRGDGIDLRHQSIPSLQQQQRHHHQQNLNLFEQHQSIENQNTNENKGQMIGMNGLQLKQQYNEHCQFRSLSLQRDRLVAQQQETTSQQDQIFHHRNYYHNQLKPPGLGIRSIDQFQHQSELKFGYYQLNEESNSNHGSQNDLDSKIRYNDGFETYQRLTQKRNHLQLDQQQQQKQQNYQQQCQQLKQNLNNHQQSLHKEYHLAQHTQSDVKSYMPQSIQSSALNQEQETLIYPSVSNNLSPTEPEKLDSSRTIQDPRYFSSLSTQSSELHSIPTATTSLFLQGCTFEPVNTLTQQLTHDSFDAMGPSFSFDEQQAHCWRRQGSSQALDIIPMTQSKFKRRFSNTVDQEVPRINSQSILGQAGLLLDIDNTSLKDHTHATSLEIKQKRLKKETLF